ncbi:hypothetical protein F975_01760 [Acinetobacter sp. ANC 3789]|nr:hypothetical protein F975_01760 [Acinetobacter sp. ANC 3789]
MLSLNGCSKTEKSKPIDQKQGSDLNKYAEEQKDKAAKIVNINPKMDIVNLAKCTAASMKIGQGIGIYKVWTEELTNRYRKIYPDKSVSELDSYVGERITDKLRSLRESGFDSQQAFSKYYDMNCKN